LVEDLIPEPGDYDQRLVLTAAHLFKEIPDGATASFTPPGPEPSSTDGQDFGTVRRRVPLEFVYEIVVDAAVIKPYTDVECCNTMGCGEPAGVRDLLVRSEQDSTIPVTKLGASTQETSGELLSIQSVQYMDDVEARYSTGWWTYGPTGTPFAAKGDSGSVVVDEQRNVVGMVVAVNKSDDCFVHAIKPILSALKVRLPGTSELSG
jgi:hypothetical protein